MLVDVLKRSPCCLCHVGSNGPCLLNVVGKVDNSNHTRVARDHSPACRAVVGYQPCPSFDGHWISSESGQELYATVNSILIMSLFSRQETRDKQTHGQDASRLASAEKAPTDSRGRIPCAANSDSVFLPGSATPSRSSVGARDEGIPHELCHTMTR
jgi:hypothetical protein